MKYFFDLPNLEGRSDFRINLKLRDLVDPAIVHRSCSFCRNGIFSHAVAVVQISVRPFSQTGRHLLPRFLRIGVQRAAGIAASDENLILFAAELAAAHVEVRALLVIFFAKIVGGVGDEVEVLVAKGRPVFSFETVFVQPHEGGILGDPRIQPPVGHFGLRLIGLAPATQVHRLSWLAVRPMVRVRIGATIGKRAVEEAAIVGIESASHFIGEALQVSENSKSSLFGPGIDDCWMFKDRDCKPVSQSIKSVGGMSWRDFSVPFGNYNAEDNTFNNFHCSVVF